MKKAFILMGGAMCVMTSCQCGISQTANLKTEQDSVSYSLGVTFGNYLREQYKQLPVDTIDYVAYAKALCDSKLDTNYAKNVKAQLDEIDGNLFMAAARAQLAYGKAAIDMDMAQGILNKKSTAKRAEMQAKREAEAAANEAAGRSFLESNIKAEGVDSTATGLQYKVLVAGNGPKPTATDRVKVNYRGTLIDGTEFDASPEGAPSTFGVSAVIKGWTEALQMMPVGSKWEIYVPSNLAYGKRGAGEKIGPNATLIFEIELVEIVK
ncbi:MAG: FKBP-type peptidyl-prolyl cis-trans isomerase [Marinilabiliaceae bacterium]